MVLNSAPKVDWAGDFLTMKNLGYTDVVLRWGLDSSGVVTRPQETLHAIRLAKEADMGAYLIVWHPESNSLERWPGFMQIDSEGHSLESFDVFNREWRSTEWKAFLRKIAKTYGSEPGMAGDVFDDSFTTRGTSIVSYGKTEAVMFGSEPPCTMSDPRWNEWVQARQGYRIGDYAKKRKEWSKWVPPEPAPSLLTGQFPEKFLWDRPEVHQALAVYRKSLNNRK
jgi:hypothetical protein